MSLWQFDPPSLGGPEGATRHSHCNTHAHAQLLGANGPQENPCGHIEFTPRT